MATCPKCQAEVETGVFHSCDAGSQQLGVTSWRAPWLQQMIQDAIGEAVRPLHEELAKVREYLEKQIPQAIEPPTEVSIAPSPIAPTAKPTHIEIEPGSKKHSAARAKTHARKHKAGA